MKKNKQVNFRGMTKDKYAGKFDERKIFLVCEEACVCLCGKDGRVEVIPNHYTSQVEAGTRIMLHMQHAVENDDKAIIVY